MKDIEEILNEIEGIFNEHGDCEHDTIGRTEESPEELHVSYSISKEGLAELRKLLEAK